MKNRLVAAVGAVLFAGTIAAGAATVPQPANESATAAVTATYQAPVHSNSNVPSTVDLAHQRGGEG